MPSAADLAADGFIAVARAAEPQARLIGGSARGVAVLGMVGAVLGSLGIAMPGIGFVEAWGLVVALVLLALLPAVVVWRWSAALRRWSGDVTQAAERLRHLSLADEALGDVAGALRSGPGGPGASVMRLTRAGRQMWRLRGRVDGLRDLIGALTGPFRPPGVGMRFAALAGGMVVMVAGPLTLLVALIV